MAKKWPPKGYPLVDAGRYQLTDQWTIELPDAFARRIQDGSLVLWRPGLTLWCDAWGNDHRASRSTRLREIRAKISAAATAIREASDSQVTRLVYRLRDSNDDGPVESVNAFVFSDAGHLQMAVYFETDEAVATAIADSVRVSR